MKLIINYSDDDKEIFNLLMYKSIFFKFDIYYNNSELTITMQRRCIDEESNKEYNSVEKLYIKSNIVIKNILEINNQLSNNKDHTFYTLGLINVSMTNISKNKYKIVFVCQEQRQLEVYVSDVFITLTDISNPIPKISHKLDK